MKRFFAALVATLALVPAVTSAAVISVSPQKLVLEIGGRVFAKVSASATSSHLEVYPSSCFTTAGSPGDILKVTGLNKSRSGNSSTLTLDVRAQRPGRCTIKFQSESDVRSIDVNVEPEQP